MEHEQLFTAVVAASLVGGGSLMGAYSLLWIGYARKRPPAIMWKIPGDKLGRIQVVSSVLMLTFMVMAGQMDIRFLLPMVISIVVMLLCGVRAAMHDFITLDLLGRRNPPCTVEC